MGKEYYNEIIWEEIGCPTCKGKGSIEYFANVDVSQSYNTTFTNPHHIIKTCSVCNGYKTIKRKSLKIKVYKEFNKFEIMDI
jgi:DnaJ-class molecular chaperone